MAEVKHIGSAALIGCRRRGDDRLTLGSGRSREGISEVLGEIVWLMSQSPIHKQFYISDLEWFVMTPVLLQQFRIFYASDRPVGVLLWAFVSDEVEARLAQGVTRLSRRTGNRATSCGSWRPSRPSEAPRR
jgi:hemolysin-activating ACP:hemolysin acyltransferase